MKNQIKYILFIISIIIGQSCDHTNDNQSNVTYMDNLILSPEYAHTKAQKLLIEDFYWSPVEESSPFGNDEGSDAFFGFREWRDKNRHESPIVYLEKLINDWEYPQFDWYTLDTTLISNFITSNNSNDDTGIQEFINSMKERQKESAEKEGKKFDEALFNKSMNSAMGDMGFNYLYGIDNAIIAVGFGQFVLEGSIDKELKEITKIAIQREMTHILLDRWEDYKEERIRFLNHMLSDIDKIELR